MQILEKLAKAKKELGHHWVMHPNSTYHGKRRQPGLCHTLRPVVAKAVAEGRL